MFTVSRSRAFACALLTLLLAALIVVASASAEEDVLGNNLSVPVIFAEGYNIVGGDVSDPLVGSGFRSTELSDNFDALTTYTPIQWLGVLDPVTGDPLGLDLAGNPLLSNWFYAQKTEAAWQAEWVDATDSATLMTTVGVSRLDWGDSLLAKAWTARSKIRLEIRLYRGNDLPSSDGDPGLKGYGMNHLSGAGSDEVWGAADLSAIGAPEASGNPYIVTPAETTVYSNCARLSLYALDDNGEITGPELLDGDGMAVADKYGTDGPGYFGAEVNVGGYVLYGYTLDAKARGLAAGDYRVVFSLDDSAKWDDDTTFVTRNAVITGLDPIDSAAGEWPFYSEFDVADGTASWVDFYLIAKSGGGKPR